MSKRITTLSGLRGEQYRLRKPYSDYADFERCAEMYNLHGRLGYKTPKAAWKANPIVQCSVNPSDFCRVDAMGRRYTFNSNWGAGDLCRPRAA